jgi:hypothetical protein
VTETTETEKRWLRRTVLLAILTASVTVVLLVLVAGATATESFREGSLTAMTNCTMWNTFSSVSGASMMTLLIPVVAIAMVIIATLILLTTKCAYEGGMA